MEQVLAAGIPVTSEPGISIELVLASAQFTNWLASMDRERFTIRSIHLQAVNMFGETKVGFIELKADVVDAGGNFVPGIVFMRGGAVAMLVVLACKGQNYAVLTVQPRLATGDFDFIEIPSGMLDGSGHFAGVAAKELQEELGLTIAEEELTDLTSMAGHHRGFFLSPGGSDETIRVFYFRKEVSEDELAEMSRRLTGVLAEGEQIKLRIMPIDDIWTVPDAKTVVAYALYRNLQLSPR